MWPPPNIQSLPSIEEIQSVNEEISTIELEIIEAELRLDALRKSLLERKAWISPIRKTPHEILSLISIEVSKTNWKAPLVLQSVCRRWRDVVVDSPEAWTFIPLSKYISKGRSELISLFLERSRNTPLHVSVRDRGLLGCMGLLADRIECIILKTTTFLLNRYLQGDHTFHRLERLTIWHADSAADDPAAWNLLLFPNLQVLGITSPSASLLRAISAAPEFPAIRHLIVYCTVIWRPLDILIKCATSLESVDLIYRNLPSGGPDTEHDVNFPRLKYMQLGEVSNEAGPRLHIQAVTPNLQAYLDIGTISTFNTIKVDTGNVILLHVLHTPDLSLYPRLVTLCFSREDGQHAEIGKAIESLQDNPTLCPDLALIEYTAKLAEEQIAKVRDALRARGEVTGHIIQLTKGNPDVREKRMEALTGLEEVRFSCSSVPVHTPGKVQSHPNSYSILEPFLDSTLPFLALLNATPFDESLKTLRLPFTKQSDLQQMQPGRLTM